jgi:serine/threonine-protein kinase HipA
MRHLDVYLNNDLVGILSSDEQQRFIFQYAPEWIARKDVPLLSVSLPLQESPFPDEKARPFFSNLLPEANVREAVARKLGISPRNEFALLEALGGECAGAVALLPKGADGEMDTGYRPLTPETFRKLIDDLPKKPFLAGEEGMRLSLAGAQYKLPVFIEGGNVSIPQGSSASSHIVKPAIESIEHSVRNEAFCMALAERIGMNVPRSWVVTIPAELFIIERYDRYRNESGQILRIHQEDFCQAMGLMADTKYESEGGPSL